MNFPILSSLILLPTIGALFILASKSNYKSNFQTNKYIILRVGLRLTQQPKEIIQKPEEVTKDIETKPLKSAKDWGRASNDPRNKS